jgi:hypothetical protein
MKKTLLAAPVLVIIIFLLVCYRIVVFGGTEKRSDLQYRADIGVGEAAGLAMMAYAEHHGGRLPDARHWEEDIQPYWVGPFSVTMQSHSGDRMAMSLMPLRHRTQSCSMRHTPAPKTLAAYYYGSNRTRLTSLQQKNGASLFLLMAGHVPVQKAQVL